MGVRSEEGAGLSVGIGRVGRSTGVGRGLRGVSRPLICRASYLQSEEVKGQMFQEVVGQVHVPQVILPEGAEVVRETAHLIGRRPAAVLKTPIDRDVKRDRLPPSPARALLARASPPLTRGQAQGSGKPSSWFRDTSRTRRDLSARVMSAGSALKRLSDTSKSSSWRRPIQLLAGAAGKQKKEAAAPH